MRCKISHFCGVQEVDTGYLLAVNKKDRLSGQSFSSDIEAILFRYGKCYLGIFPFQHHLASFNCNIESFHHA